MAENELMIPEGTEVPAHISNKALAAQTNADAMAGISAGALARIKLSGKQFTIVDESGEETPVLAGHMTLAADQNQYLGCIALGAKVAIQKSFYAGKYVPGEDGEAPDCFSENGVSPDPSVQAPMCESCAKCLKNAWGSGTDQNDNATKGKACADSKVLAVFVPKFKKVLKLKLPPASLKNFRTFVGELGKKNIPLTHINMMLGFDPSSEFSVLIFRFGGFLPEAAIPKLEVMQASDEVLDIVNEKTQAALPAPAETKTAPVEKVVEKAAEKVVEKAAEKVVEKAAEKVVEPVVTTVADGDLGLGLEEAVVVETTTADTTNDDLTDAFADMGITL